MLVDCSIILINKYDVTQELKLIAGIDFIIIHRFSNKYKGN